MELLDATDLNSTSLWQCCLKVLAKNPTIDDMTKVSALVLLVKHCAIVSKNPHLQDLGKWFQFLRASLKLNKHSLRKVQIPGSYLLDIVEIIKAQPENPITPDLLALPFKSLEASSHTEADVEFLRSLANVPKSFPPGTIGNFILKPKSPIIPSKRDEISPSASLAFKYSGIQLGFWVDLCSTAFSVKDQRRYLQILKNLVSAIVQVSLGMAPSTELTLLRICLRKFLAKSSPVEIRNFGTIEQLILIAHMNKIALKLVQLPPFAHFHIGSKRETP